MTCVNVHADRGLLTRVLVRDPHGHEFISADPPAVCDTRYPWGEGYELHTITGHDLTVEDVYAGQGAA